MPRYLDVTLGPDDKSCLQFGQNNYKPEDEVDIRHPDLQYVFLARVDTARLVETRECINWQHAFSVTNEENIILDSGASILISFSKDNFTRQHAVKYGRSAVSHHHLK